MNPDTRLPAAILEGADTIGVRTLGVPEEFGGIELEPKQRSADLRAHLGGNRARRFRARRQAGAELESLGAAAQSCARHLQEKWFKRLLADPQFLLAHCLTEPRGASDRWLPYNVPEAAMQTRA